MSVCFGEDKRMYRVASFPLVLALAAAAFPHGAAAQRAGDPSESRGPRFLLAMAERSRPMPVDPAVQLGIIVGTVTAAETGAPLARATVNVVGTHLSAEADTAGRYVIGGVPVGTHRLRARMLGYAPADTSVVVEEGQEAVVNFQLKAQAIELQAIVTVGYGEKRREDLTGAVGSVSSQALESRPITNTMAALQGAMPGLIVQRTSGQPGVEGFDLNLRGVSSANGGMIMQRMLRWY